MIIKNTAALAANQRLELKIPCRTVEGGGTG
jgi:hypothetical protein